MLIQYARPAFTGHDLQEMLSHFLNICLLFLICHFIGLSFGEEKHLLHSHSYKKHITIAYLPL